VDVFTLSEKFKVEKQFPSFPCWTASKLKQVLQWHSPFRSPGAKAYFI